MTPAARSIHIFGIYLLVAGALMFGAPNTLTSLLALPAPTDPWLRVLGVPVMSMGMQYMATARSEQTGFFRATVWVRFFVLVALTLLVVLRLAPPILIAFGLIDAVGAIWTKLSLARGAVGASTA